MKQISRAMARPWRTQGTEEHEFSTPHPFVGSLHRGKFVRRQRFLALSEPVDVFSHVRQRGFRQAVEGTVQLLSGDDHGQHPRGGPPGNSTRRSMSLAPCVSPRAAEPNKPARGQR